MLPVCVDDYRTLARAAIAPDAWDYIDGGAGAELTLAANRTAFERVRLRPRFMVDVSARSTATTVLGLPMGAPIGIAPTAYHELCHPEGELATAAGADRAGALYVAAMYASRSIEQITAVATGPVWLQLYWLRERRALAQLIARANACGVKAIVLTVDTPVIGRRRRDMRNSFTVDPSISAANFDRDPALAPSHRQAGQSSIASQALQAFDTTLNWTDLAWLRQQTDLPLVLKGILTAQDATLALEHGADAIVVSNHGGRQLDGAPATLHALVEVVDAVAGGCPVLMDGGIRCGTDVFTALALGACAVLVGRPVLWGLATAGADGVAGVLDLLAAELSDTMMLTGRTSVAELDRSAVQMSTVE